MPSFHSSTLAQSLHLPALVWLDLVLTVSPGDRSYEAFRERLHTFMRYSGIAAALAGERLALIGTPGPVRPEDKALVMHWLIQQPQVIMIAMRRTAQDRQDEQKVPRHG